MRSIEISTELFARIWASRMPGEESENAILSRLLGIGNPAKASQDFVEKNPGEVANQKVRWRDDVYTALLELGGSASLRAIYDQTRKIRLENGRSVPPNLQAIVRRELEYNSSDSHVFTGRHDWFRSIEGIGGGQWALRGGVG